MIRLFIWFALHFYWLQSMVSEEDDDEDEEEGKAAVQADEKNKNNKPGLHGLFSSHIFSYLISIKNC